MKTLTKATFHVTMPVTVDIVAELKPNTLEIRVKKAKIIAKPDVEYIKTRIPSDVTNTLLDALLKKSNEIAHAERKGKTLCGSNDTYRTENFAWLMNDSGKQKCQDCINEINRVLDKFENEENKKDGTR